jgi:hypothetical protein
MRFLKIFLRKHGSNPKAGEAGVGKKQMTRLKTSFIGSLSLVFFFLPAAQAEDRPSEASMFSANPSTASTTAPSSALPLQPQIGRDDAHELQSAGGRDAFATGEVSDNPLQIGGLYYQRWIASQLRGQAPSHDPVSMPLQFDAFMDARPNDRVRGFVQGRVLYDPTRDQFSNPTNSRAQGSLQYASTSGAPQSLTTGTTNQTTNNPQGVLDQAWLKFDVERKVFITVGKQHVKWGTGRFWNPTDFLSTQRRDPLLPYDLRLGNTMVKFGMPLQSKGTNLSGIVLLDNPQPGSTLGQTGGAFRAETLVGNAEVGVDAVGRGNVAPTYGADVSAPLGPFDVYSEAALFSKSPVARYQRTGSATPGADIASLYALDQTRGPFVQATAGGNYSFGWRENREATVGVEYFYNQLGYDSASIYPVLIFLGSYQPFYTGTHYGAIYLTAEGPDAAKHTSYTFSTLSNLSDGSLISRIDFSWRLLTYLTFEAYADDHYGTRGGEFRFELHTPQLTSAGATVQPIDLPATVFDVGMGLRLSF